VTVPPVEVDGSQGEGGGQIVRTAAALAARSNTPIRVTDVRANRDPPGLKAQHVAALDAVAKACRGSLDGDEPGSSTFTLRPGRVEGGNVRVDTGTAASTTLVVEALLALAPALPTPLTVEARGGTDVRWSPTLDHLRSVLVPLLDRAGVDVEVLATREGFYPKGGGRIRALVPPAQAPAWDGVLEDRGALKQVTATVRVVRQAGHAHRRGDLLERAVPVSSRVHQVEAACPGVVVDAVARFEDTVLGANVVGEKGLPSETVGERCAQRLLDELESPATVDVHAADQLVPFLLGRVDGGFVVRDVTSHLATNADLCERFLDEQVRFEDRPDGATTVRFAT